MWIEERRLAAAILIWQAKGATLQAIADTATGSFDGRGRPFQERVRIRRKRRNFIRVERSHQPRRDQDHQLRLFGPLRLALKQRTNDRKLAEDWNGCLVILVLVVK